MSYDPANYPTANMDVDYDDDAKVAALSLMWCRRCGVYIADPERHDRACNGWLVPAR